MLFIPGCVDPTKCIVMNAKSILLFKQHKFHCHFSELSSSFLSFPVIAVAFFLFVEHLNL